MAGGLEPTRLFGAEVDAAIERVKKELPVLLPGVFKDSDVGPWVLSHYH